VILVSLIAPLPPHSRHSSPSTPGPISQMHLQAPMYPSGSSWYQLDQFFDRKPASGEGGRRRCRGRLGTACFPSRSSLLHYADSRKASKISDTAWPEANQTRREEDGGTLRRMSLSEEGISGAVLMRIDRGIWGFLNQFALGPRLPLCSSEKAKSHISLSAGEHLEGREIGDTAISANLSRT